jgi:hypothetical protein
LVLDRYFHAERDYSYIVLGHLLTELHAVESESEKKFPGMHKTIAIGRLLKILHRGKDLLCFSAEEKYEGSVRERVTTLICKQFPGITHQELYAERSKSTIVMETLKLMPKRVRRYSLRLTLFLLSTCERRMEHGSSATTPALQPG